MKLDQTTVRTFHPARLGFCSLSLHEDGHPRAGFPNSVSTYPSFILPRPVRGPRLLYPSGTMETPSGLYFSTLMGWWFGGLVWRWTENWDLASDVSRNGPSAARPGNLHPPVPLHPVRREQGACGPLVFSFPSLKNLEHACYFPVTFIG